MYEDHDLPPHRFRAYFDLDGLPEFSAELSGDSLIEVTYDTIGKPLAERVVPVSVYAWKRFLRKIEQANVDIWSWDVFYGQGPDSHAALWEFELSIAGRSVQTGGAHGYPTAQGMAKNPSKRFPRVRAMQPVPTKPSVPTWAMVLLAVVLIGGTAVMAIVGVGAWMLSYRYAAVTDALEGDPDAVVHAEAEKWQPERVVGDVAVPVDPDAIPGVTMEEFSKGLQQIGLDVELPLADENRALVSFEKKDEAVTFSATLSGPSADSVHFVTAIVIPEAPDADAEKVFSAALPFFENLASIPSRGEQQRQIATWLSAITPETINEKDFGNCRLFVAFGKEGAKLVINRATCQLERSAPIAAPQDASNEQANE